MRYYTWKDIERELLVQRKGWEDTFDNIEVYPDELIVYCSKEKDDSEIIQKLYELFPKNTDRNDKSILLEGNKQVMKITIEFEDEGRNNKIIPLFEKVIYSRSAYPEEQLKPLPCPVVAFHSYKGGVGRTLSLLAFAKAWSEMQGEKKLLIIDSDIEAPGLSWLQGKIDENGFSYLDLLTMLQDSQDIESVVEFATEQIRNSVISVETNQQTVEHFFLPTLRYDEQLFDIYASPSSVIKGKDRQYMLAEVLSQIADRLGVNMTLVDMRAGISEYSAPLLFDPRVKKYIVTSTSEQSVIGTKKLLQYMGRGLAITEDANLPTVFLGMIPPSISLKEKNDIITEIVECFKTNEKEEQLLDNLVVELPFASELIHLTDLQQILTQIEGRDMYKEIKKVVQSYLDDPIENDNINFDEYRNKALREICTFANKQITAESNHAVQILLTAPIKNLCLKYADGIPTVVVRGAKGAGKTFLYRQFIEKQNWFAFSNEINHRNNKENGYFIPVFAPKNITEFTKLFGECIATVNTEIESAQVSASVYLDNSQKLEKQMTEITDWRDFWEKLLASSVNKNWGSFDEVSDKLRKEDKKAVFLIDGLEEILRNVSGDLNQQKAVQTLCQDIVNIMAAKYDNLGIVIFLRSDMAQNAITVNYEQFKQANGYAELKWTSDEALKLVVWVVSQAVKDFYEAKSPIENASKEVIDLHLEKLWGQKLGKNSSNEAYSSRWILAALSDFNGQLQARDIIRFLKYAAVSNGKKASYEDRILMPAEIRHAVSICSTEKIDEIKMEYAFLKPIFEKLEKLPAEQKVLPLDLNENVLSRTEEKLMMQEGYLIRDGEKLYLPEIVRHALGFHYARGARPKVLSLLLKHVETVIGQINRKSGGLGMPYVSPVVENDFKDRLNKCVDIIKNSSIKYQSLGIFGSYARNDYKASSDIDFCIIVPEKPERWMMGALREELEMLHADVVFVTPQYFEHDNSKFTQQLRRDYKELKI